VTLVLPCSLLMAPAVMRQFEKENEGCATVRDRARALLLRTLLTRIPLNIGPADES
jgi:hypothetical protein